MTTVSGDNVTYTIIQFLGASNNILERNTITANSTDVTPTGTEIATEYGGITGQSFELSIYNNSNFTITLTTNTGVTMSPGPSDTISAGTIKKYVVTVTGATTATIFNTNFNGTPIESESIKLMDTGEGINLQAPNGLGATYTLTFPLDDGNNGEILSTDGSGNLSWTSGGGTGDVVGPSSATDNAIARYDTTTGKLIQNSGVTIDDNDNITGANAVTATGTVTGGSLTDGSALISSGAISGVTTLTASSTITGGSITDGTATLNSGTLTGLVAPTLGSDAANKAYVDAQSGFPAGANTQIQYNNNGSFGGDVNFTWNSPNQLLTVTGKQTLGTFADTGTPSASGTQMELQSHTFTDDTGGPTTALATFVSFGQPTLAATATTTTNVAATMYIAGAPVEGTNETIEEQYALLVNAGAVRMNSTLTTAGNIVGESSISGQTITDGTFSTTAGNVTGLNNLTASGTIQGTSLTDGTATLNSGSLIGLIAPTVASEAANKAYVDSVAVGLSFKQPVRVATTTNLVSLSGEQTIDGISTTTGDRVLVKDGTNANPNVDNASIDNGIYIVDTGAWSRSSDMAVSSDAAGSAMFVEEGTTWAASGFVCNNPAGGGIVGTDDLEFAQFTGTGQLTAGSGIDITGNTISTDIDDVTIGYTGNSMFVKNQGIDTTQIADDAVTTVKIPDNAITNAKIQNSTITVTAGDGLQSGGTINLGGTVTIDVDGTVLRTTGDQSASGIQSFTNTTDSTDFTTGTVVISGGLGIAKNTFSNANITSAGTIEGDTLTDGTLTVNSGSLTGATTISGTTITASGTLTGGTVTDGTFSSTAGAITGVTTLTASSTITGGSLTDGTATLSSGTLTGLITPTAGSDAANKAYVDSVSQGLEFKDPVRVATTTNGTLSSDFENGDLIDGINIATNDRILIKDQTNQIENGIYTVNATGAPTRALDMASGSAENFATLVEEGTQNSSSSWVVTGDSPFTIGTSNIVWTQYASGGVVNAGAGLSKSGNTLNVNFDDVTIGLDTDILEVKDGGIGTLQIATGAITTIKIANANVTNAKLQNSSITITAGDGLQMGGVAALGGSVTLDVDNTVLRTTGNQSYSGIQEITNTTDATSANPLTGALQISGGMSVAKNTFSNANITASGTIEGGTVTDGTITTTSGVVTGAVSIATGSLTATGTVTGNSITDGSATLTNDTLTAANSIISAASTLSYIPAQRVLYTTTGGLITSDAGFQFDGTLLLSPEFDTQTITRPNDANLASLWSDGTGNIDIGLNSTGTIQIGNGPTLELTQTSSTLQSELTIQDNFSRVYTVADINTAANVTYTAQQFFDGLIRRDPNGSTRTDTTPTAAQLVAIVPNRVIGSSIEVIFENTANALELVTIVAGTGVIIRTPDNQLTIENAITTRFLVVFDNVTLLNEAVSIYAAAPRDRTIIQASITDPFSGSQVTRWANWGPTVAPTVVDGFVVGYSGRIVQLFCSYSKDTPIQINQVADRVEFSIGTANSTLTTFTAYPGGTNIVVWTSADNNTYPATTSGLLNIPIQANDRIAIQSQEINSVAPTSGVEIRLAVTIELD